MKKGFTLIELIFVIVIIGLLAAVAVPKFLSTKKNSEVANLPEIGNMVVTKAVEQYTLVRRADLDKIVQSDKDLNLTLDKTNGKLVQTDNFITDYNATEVNVSYRKANGTQGAVCLRVNRASEDINTSQRHQVTTYNFRVTEINQSCNMDQ